MHTTKQDFDKNPDTEDADQLLEIVKKDSIVSYPHLEKILSQLGKQQKPNDAELEKALEEALKLNSKEVMKFLLDKTQFDVNHQGQSGETLLHKVISTTMANSSAAMANLLIEQGANVNAKDIKQETPLHKAITYRKSSIVKILLQRGANIEEKDENGATPLHKAVAAWNVEAVETLLNHDPKNNKNLKDARDNKGKTPWDYLDTAERINLAMGESNELTQKIRKLLLNK